MAITYISLLRGINVSGQKIIKMDALKKTYEHLGLAQVKTYVQSGNVVFSSVEIAPQVLAQQIRLQIKSDFGFDVPVIVLHHETLKDIAADNPFIKDVTHDMAAVYLTFLASEPDQIDKERILSKKQDGEEIVFSKDVVYLYCPKGYGKTKLNNSFLEKMLAVSATTRNWKTTQELLRMAGY